MSRYFVPAGSAQHQQVIKKSQFITFVAAAAEVSHAHAYIDSIRKQYPDARHVCWAYLIGKPNQTTLLRCSDDGEPAGTAGKPMLHVLQHSGLGDVVAVVVRYFGGIKLGTGGLVRAYSSSVNDALALIESTEKVTMISLSFYLPYSMEDWLRRALSNFSAGVVAVEYGERLQIDCQCPKNQQANFLSHINDHGRGLIELIDPDSLMI